MHSPHIVDRRPNRMTNLATAGLLLAMLLMLNSCTSWKNAADFKDLTTRTLEGKYLRAIQLENQVDAKVLKSYTKPGTFGKPGLVELQGKPFWTAPQYDWIRSIDTAVMSESARRRMKLRCIKKYGVGFVVFKPDPADQNFLNLGESDDKGFTMADLHRAFGPNLPPFTSLLRLCLNHK
ncbi:MAG: hypothetical protein K9N47_27965 [Prosthecobacter sp.]|uniref:hypothetical protein n=1 Tax=Prosthecobacter sp. TaxID=1965333 RepID=UPI002605A5EF|nr:hypothetical protein [Prosthecobacter sp.]MCF7789988.1 hypothetical protein [Prosthecobacter sp.]